MTECNPQQTTVSRAPRPPLWPLGPIKGGAIREELGRRDVALVGSRPDQLGIAIEMALSHYTVTFREADGIEDSLPQHAAASVERHVAIVAPLMLKLFKAAPLSGAYKEVMSADYDVDPLYIAALRVLGGNNAGGAGRLAQAFHLLTDLAPARAPRSGGLPPVRDAVYLIVRVVVHYRTWCKLPVTSEWNILKDRQGRKGRRTNDECLPVSHTAELLRLVADILKIPADNATLRGALNRYLKQLRDEGRVPGKADWMQIDIVAR